MNYIWSGLLATGFIIGIINGRLEEVTQAALTSAGRAVELSIGLLGIICLWSGLMKIMDKAGMVGGIAKLARPALKLFFPGISGNNNAMGAIVMNLAANFMGLGNAATPLGIKAMEELQAVNDRRDTASDAMCMFLVLNTTAIQLIPTTVIAIRSDAGSAAPAEITSCIWIASLSATIAGVLLAKVLAQLWPATSATRGTKGEGSRKYLRGHRCEGDRGYERNFTEVTGVRRIKGTPLKNNSAGHTGHKSSLSSKYKTG